MEKSITVGDQVYAPIIEQYEFKEVIDFYDGPLSGSVEVDMRSYFYYFVDWDASGHAIFRVVKTTQAELRQEIAQCGQPVPRGKVLSREEQYGQHATVGYIVW